MSAARPASLAPFDAADYLTTPELVMEYLNAVLAEKDVAFLQAALETIARSPAMAALGTPGDVRVDRRDAGPDFEGVVHLLAAMGLRLQVAAS